MPSASLDIAQPPPVAQRQRSCRSSVDAEPHSLPLHFFCSLRFPWKLLYFHFCLRQGQRGGTHVAGSGNSQVTYDSGQNLTHTHAKDPDQRMNFFFTYTRACVCLCVCHMELCVSTTTIQNSSTVTGSLLPILQSLARTYLFPMSTICHVKNVI